MSDETIIEANNGAGVRRLGAFGGVFTPSILTILGVVMYLLLPWVVGNMGLAGAMMVIGLAHLISFITGLSVSSIATNRTVGPGGAYYMISRSLGAPAGAAVGIPLFFAQALSLSFYTVGFASSLMVLLPDPAGHPFWSHIIDIRFLAALSCIGLCLLALRSAEAAIKAQYFVMGAIGLSLISLLLGGFDRSMDDIEWFISSDTARDINAQGFSVVFAVFFPAVTGIMAGVSMSGDLRDPRRALPRGTLLAIMAGFVIYMILPFVLALKFDVATLAADKGTLIFDAARWPFLIHLGLWGATLSSAVGCILAAPRTLQALAIDGLAPRFMGRGHGPTNEPRVGLVFTFLLAICGILLGSLDLIAQLLSIFFLATYGITNFACGLENWAKNPSFRPTFRVPAWISLGGAFACFYVMSIIDLKAMIAAAGICAVIYAYVQRRSLNTTYGDARHGLWSALVRTALHHLHRSEYHDVNWRPNLLIFGGPPARRRYLLEMGASVVQERGLTSYVQMLEGEVSELAQERRVLAHRLDELKVEYPNVFFRADIVPDVYRGILTISQSYGIGPLEANTVLLGWLNKADRAGPYFEMLRDLVELKNTLMLMKFDEQRRFGERRQVHVWWGGLERNGGMMLLMAYLIVSHHAWRQAEVTTLTVVNDEADVKRAEEGLNRVLESARLEAKPRVLLRNERSLTELLAQNSSDADLAIIGLRLPSEGEDPEMLFEHYNTLLSGLPTTLLVHSGGEFNAAPVLFDDDA
jgi:amino acid transporter